MLFENSKYSVMILVGILSVSVLLFGYLMWFVSPENVVEKVRIVANTESGCIGETVDGFSVNVGPCDAEPGEVILATVDAKVKQREKAMNP